jgi:uncharacterized protein
MKMASIGGVALQRRSGTGRDGLGRALVFVGLTLAFATVALDGAYGQGSDTFNPRPEIGRRSEPGASPNSPASTPQNSADALLQAARRGDAAAQARLGEIYLFRQQGDRAQNLAESVKWYRASASQGNGVGQAGLGQLYDLGLGVTQNKAEAVRLYRLGAEQGSTLGQFGLGRAYLNGDGVPQDFSEARAWLSKAADKGHADAINLFGTMYANGQGMPADLAEAAKRFRQAAEKGSAVAQNNLAAAYMAGRGVARDDMLAYFWYNLAASRLPQSQRAAAVISRDAVARRLTPAELERAQAVAHGWKPGDAVEAALRRDLPPATAGAPAAGSSQASQATRPAASSGTGFVVTKAGHVLTNAHVVETCGEIRARQSGEPAIRAEIVAKDRANDLALVKLQKPVGRVVTFRSDPPVRAGDGVVIYGFPLAGALADDGSLTTGTVSALAGLGNDSRMLQVSAPVQPGNSGGPLVDMSGNVIGVVVSKLNALAVAAVTGDVPQNVNFAIKGGVARNFLEANGIDYQNSASSAQLSASDVGDRIKRSTVRVECLR